MPTKGLRWGYPSQFRSLNRRKSAQRTLLVSADLTADEIPATGGHRRFVPAPTIADVAWLAEQSLLPLLLGDTKEAIVDTVVLLARRLSAAKPDAKHPGKSERKAGK